MLLDINVRIAPAEQRSMLTPRGWPRPYNDDGYPIPWATPKDNLAVTDPQRLLAAVFGLLCQVCGEGHYPDEAVFMFVNDDVPEDPGSKIALAMDDAVMHERCAKLTLGRCPGVGAIQAKGPFSILLANSSDIEVRYDHEDDEDGERPRLAVRLDKAKIMTYKEFRNAT